MDKLNPDGPTAVVTGPLDAYPPAEIARLVEGVGVKKANLAMVPTLALGVLAGAFIAFGAMLFTLVMTGNDLGFGPGRWLGGIAFSLGLILVVIGGAELFTGNSLIVMAWADRRITTMQILRNWSLVFAANFIGAIGAVLMVHESGVLTLGDGAVAATAMAIAEAKVALGVAEAFWRGVLCNVLVCLAVWLCFAAHSVSSKIIAIIFPISAFVALGFEHSIANMYLIPIAMLSDGSGISMMDFLGNLLPVTLGNMVGGGVLVALVYWLIYLRKA
ncbi:MAG: formate/nitrite transporter family protein [Alphaproteobacteria bacterium]|nr:formate/nitrite transporter family protein [Alphaproteobacteria bacterium]